MKLSQKKQNKLKKLFDEGIRGPTEMAKQVGCSRQTAKKHMDKYQEEKGEEKIQKGMEILDEEMSNEGDGVQQEVSQNGEEGEVNQGELRSYSVIDGTQDRITGII